MGSLTHHSLLQILAARYAPYGVRPYQRNGQAYPFAICDSAPSATLETLLSTHPPTTPQSKESFAFYDEGIVSRLQQTSAALYDGTTFAFDCFTGNPPRLHATLGSYFDHLNTSIALEEELLAGGDTHWRALCASVTPGQLLTHGAGRSASLGMSVLTVFKQQDRYQALVVQRSGQTAHMPGALHVLPAFQFQPTAQSDAAHDWNLTRQIKREYAEELFDLPEDTDAATSEPVRQLNAMLASGDAELHYTGTVMNLQTTHLSVCALLLIHAADWHTQLNVDSAWETATTYRLPVVADEDLLAAFPAHAYQRFAPSGAAAFWLGIDKFRDETRPA